VIPEYDLRTAVYWRGVPFTADPESWPTVRVIHIPTGIVITVADEPSEQRARARAIAELESRLAETTP